MIGLQTKDYSELSNVGIRCACIDFDTNTSVTIKVGNRCIVRVYVALNGAMGYCDDIIYLSNGIQKIVQNADTRLTYTHDANARTLTINCYLNWSYGFYIAN